jgi:hypothetical protein
MSSEGTDRTVHREGEVGPGKVGKAAKSSASHRRKPGQGSQRQLLAAQLVSHWDTPPWPEQVPEWWVL